MIQTPNEILNDMISLHKYKDIKCERESCEKYILKSHNSIPKILSLFVFKNYNVTFCSKERIEFTEFLPMSFETAKNKFMNT